MKELNFTSREYRQKRINKRLIKFFISLFIILVVIELIMASILFINNQTSKDELSQVNSKMKMMQDNISGIKSNGKVDPSLDKEMNALQLIVEKESSTQVSEILKAVGNATPQKVWFTNFTYTPTEITLAGKTIESSDAYVEDDLVTLEKQLSSNSLFASVRVVREDLDSSSNLGGNYVRNFKVILILSNPFPQETTDTTGVASVTANPPQPTGTKGGANE
ncbi:MAG: hypothetical protein NTX05_06430 [Fusobacteria bacterium]|nr:hypothetical protein [Fusobacteriota bacterium]